MAAAYNDTPEGVTNRIRQVRKAHKLTLEELSAMTGISWQTLQRYETGVRAITLDKLETIAAALEVTTASLVSDAPAIDQDEQDLLDWMRQHPRDKQLILSQLRVLRESETHSD